MLKLKSTDDYTRNPNEDFSKQNNVRKFQTKSRIFKIDVRFDFETLTWILELKIFNFISTEIDINELVIYVQNKLRKRLLNK